MTTHLKVSESQTKSIDFLAEICFLFSKLHHWGHTEAVHFSYINGLGSTRALLATPHQNPNRDWRLWFLIRFSYLFILLLFWRRQVSFIQSLLQFYYSLDTKVSTNLKLYKVPFDFIPKIYLCTYSLNNQWGLSYQAWITVMCFWTPLFLSLLCSLHLFTVLVLWFISLRVCLKCFFFRRK